MKNLIKKISVPVLASRPVSALANRLLGYGIPIFMLHRISEDEGNPNATMTSDYLRRCLTYLVKHDYTFISLAELAEALTIGKTLHPRTVVFTMDDGFSDQAEITAPIFLEFDCPLTFFVITGMLDRLLWPWDAKVAWITEASRLPAISVALNGQMLELDMGDKNRRRQAKRQLHDIMREMPAKDIPATIDDIARAAEIELPIQPPESYRPMDWDMARSLESRGVQFAPHSQSHQILSRVTDTELQQEVKNSWESMQQQLKHPVKAFCYPTGRAIDFGRREVDLLEDMEFNCAVTAVPGLVNPLKYAARDLYSLPRLVLPNDINDFIQYCTWIEYAKRFQKST